MERTSTFIRCYGNIVRTSLSVFGEELQEAELRGSHAAYILAICQHPGMTQDALTRYVSVDKSNVTRNLNELERLLYVERRRSKMDRRQWQLYPTDRAYDLLPRLMEILNEWQSVLTRGMSAEEQEFFCELAERMERNVERYEAERRAGIDREDADFDTDQ